jgi:ribosomal protein L11
LSFLTRAVEAQPDSTPVLFLSPEYLQDRTFDFVLKTPPASKLILAAAGMKKGSGTPQKLIGSITEAQLKEIAVTKLPDLNATTVEAAMKVVHGTCRNMGIDVVNDEKEWEHRVPKAAPAPGM